MSDLATPHKVRVMRGGVWSDWFATNDDPRAAVSAAIASCDAPDNGENWRVEGCDPNEEDTPETTSGGWYD